MSVRILLVLAMTWGSVTSVMAQETVGTREQLLDAFIGVWLQVGRQPASEDIDLGGTYPSARYMEVWSSWDEVRQSLIERLYRQGMAATNRWDPEQAVEFFQQCLIVAPSHLKARQELKVAERNQFVGVRAGPEAAATYQSVVTLRLQGETAQAEQQYQMALLQKETYQQIEVQRLTDVYERAVSAFEQSDYATAQELFQSLVALTGRYAGFHEVYLTHAEDIDRYLALIQADLRQRKADLVSRRIRNGRFAFCVMGMYYARKSNIGFAAQDPSNLIEELMLRSGIIFE